MKRLFLVLAVAFAAASAADSEVIRVHRGPDANISSLAWDGDSLWVGYFDAGLARLHDGRWHEVAIEGAPQSRWVNTLCWDGETLWVGSNAGLSRWDAARRTLVRIEELEGAVTSVRADSGTLVVAGTDRLWIAREADWELVELPGEALHFAFAHGRTLWAGGMRGVLERRAGTWHRYTELNGRLPHSWVTALAVVGDDLWAGTYDAGLVSLAGDGPARAVVPSAWVNFNALSRTAGGVAVGTMGDGLLLWDRKRRTWNRLSTSDGLPSDDVTALVETPEALWVGTRNGLAELREP